MGNAAELRVYRARFSSIALAWVACAGFLVVGLSMVTIGPSQRGGPDTYQVTVETGTTVTAPRTASRDIRRHKASNYG
jgi:hypothetical protein